MRTADIGLAVGTIAPGEGEAESRLNGLLRHRGPLAAQEDILSGFLLRIKSDFTNVQKTSLIVTKRVKKERERWYDGEQERQDCNDGRRRQD